MSTMNQKTAVFAALCAVFGVESFDGPVVPTKEQRAQVNNILFEGFRAGRISYDGELPSDTDLKTYVSGLQSNWLRKDPRLNGGVKYVAKNPGSRAGSTDASVKAMRALLSITKEPAKRAEIQKHLDARLAQIKPNKVTEIDADALPESLRHMIETE